MPKKFRAKFAGNGAELTGKYVDSPVGKGVLSSSTKKMSKIQSTSDSDMEDLGLLNKLGDDLEESDFMCDVDENGVENKPQGVKKPGSGKPDDGYYGRVSHNHKNSISESRRSRSSLTMEELFESYIEENDVVDHEGFANYSTQHDYEEPSEEDTVDLMKVNKSFMFTPTADGKYIKTEIDSGEVSGAVDQGGSLSDIGVEDLPDMGDDGVEVDVKMSYGDDYDDSDYDDDYDDEDGDYEDADEDDEYVADEYVEEMDGEGGMNEEYVEEGGGSDLDSTVYEKYGPPGTKINRAQADEIASMYEDPMDAPVTGQGDSFVIESLTTASIVDTPSMIPKKRKKKVSKAGNPSKAVNGMKNHGEALDRKLKNDDVSESFKLPISIAKNVKAIVEHVDKQFSKIGSYKNCDKVFNVVVETKNKSFESKKTRSIVEAATDAEEIAVIGNGKVSIKVNVFEGKKNIGMMLIDLPKLCERKPHVVKEGVIFRFPSIAKRLSEVCVEEGVVHRITKHPYGVVIKGDVEKLFEVLSKKNK
jgi:hypothetical protein